MKQRYILKISSFEIESYIASGEPMDKAGAYGIQGKGAFMGREDRRLLYQCGRITC